MESEPTINIQVNPKSLEADGVSTTRISIQAETATGEGDNRPVTVSVSRGRLISSEVEIEPDGKSGRFNPFNGTIEVDFRCPTQETGSVDLTAENGAASAATTINCNSPSGTYNFDINWDDCEELVASGVSECKVEMLLEFQTAIQSFPEAGTQIDASVIEVTALDLEETPIESVLTDEEGGELEKRVSVETDADGKAFFYIRSPRLGLAQNVKVDVRMVKPDGTSFQDEVDLTIGPFSNRASMNMTVSPQSVATGQNTTIFVTAADEVGDPAFGDAVELEVPAGSGAVLRAGQDEGERVRLVLDEAGFGTADLSVPSTESEVLQLIVRAYYTPAPELPTVERDYTVRVYPEDALILNVTATPTHIRSDENESTVVRASLSRFSAGTLQPVIGKEVTFRVQSADAVCLQFGHRPEPVPPNYVPTLAVERTTSIESTEEGNDVGVATAVVAAQTDRVRGRGVIEVYVDEDGM